MVKEMESTLIGNEDRRREALSVINRLDQRTALMGIGEIFDVLRAWWAEYGESKKLIDAACVKLSLDRTAGQIYLRCPELIPVMERLRHGEPVSRLKVTMSEEGRRWWHALLVVDVLRKCSGVISHVRLVRWLGHRADAGQVRAALGLLREAGLVETYHVKANDPLRAVTWHRLTISLKDDLAASARRLPAPTPLYHLSILTSLEAFCRFEHWRAFCGRRGPPCLGLIAVPVPAN